MFEINAINETNEIIESEGYLVLGAVVNPEIGLRCFEKGFYVRRTACGRTLLTSVGAGLRGKWTAFSQCAMLFNSLYSLQMPANRILHFTKNLQLSGDNGQ